MSGSEGLSRRRLMKSAAAALPAAAICRGASASPSPSRKPNIVIFITDQERATQHFPPNWEQNNLPGLTWMKRNGLTFKNAFTNACMCSPARSTLFTGFFPAQTGVKYTLEEDMNDPSRYPQVPMPLDFKNLATVMTAAGYRAVYKGKWHCSKKTKEVWVPEDVGQYGFSRWNPRDAGANQSINQAGGGWVNNDHRFMYDDGDYRLGREGAIPFLLKVAREEQPFCLVISLVNPHDVLFYPSTYRKAGYDEEWLEGPIEVPDTADEDLSTKPTAQAQFLKISQTIGRISTRKQMRHYVNFYANLIKRQDAYLVDVIKTLRKIDLLNDTLLIRTADHGEMGMTHGGQRQKNFNFYEESIRVPLVFANPSMYRSPASTPALVSHVDFLPTMASLVGAPDSARANWQGVDYSSIVLDPTAPPVQDYTVFTYDDYQSGQVVPLRPLPPNHVMSLREARYKFARYYDVNGRVPDQYEMYDLLHDPDEIHNLAYKIDKRSASVKAEYARLLAKLDVVARTRLSADG